jgi:hypothetical protein
MVRCFQAYLIEVKIVRTLIAAGNTGGLVSAYGVPGTYIKYLEAEIVPPGCPDCIMF